MSFVPPKMTIISKMTIKTQQSKVIVDEIQGE